MAATATRPFASEDTDSEGGEERFYAKTGAEINAKLGPESAAFKTAYDMTPGANWEGRTSHRCIAPLGDAAIGSRLARRIQLPKAMNSPSPR